jgi:glucose/mannose transport system substrate-binding protein
MSRRLLVAEILCLFAVLGCNPPERGRGDVELSVYTWWTVGGEKEALDALMAENREGHPNVTIETNKAKNAEASFANLDAELQSWSPPDTFQANGGSKLLSRVIFDVENKPISADKSTLRAIDDVFDEAGTEILDFLKPLVSVKDTRYGVPLNVHRINNLYFSVPKLSKVLGQADGKMPYETLKGSLPTDLEGFFKLVQKAADYWRGAIVDDPTGELARPVGLGETDIWTLEELAFENIMPSIASSKEELRPEERLSFFEEYWSGRRTDKAEQNRVMVEETLIQTQRLWNYIQRFSTPPGTSTGGKWSEPFDRLVDPESAITFVVMGDWATGYLNEKKMRAKEDYGVVPFPGTEKLFIFTSDTLPLTSKSRFPEETKDFLVTALSINGQLRFNEKKGSVPAVKLDDTAKEQLTEAQRETLAALSDSSVEKSLAMSGVVTPDVEPDLYREALRLMLRDNDKVHGRDLVHHTLENHYWMLERWTAQLDEANRK